MKKLLILVLLLVLLCNPATLLAQSIPDEENAGTEKFETLFYESLLQKGIENYDKAIIALEQCLKIKPNEATVYSELGRNQLALKEYNNAYKSFEHATQIDPKNKWFWVGMYDVSYQTKNYNQAIPTVNKLIEFDEDYKDDLTSLYMNTNQFDKALALINELNEKVGKSDGREFYKKQILSQGKFHDTEIENLKVQIEKYPKEESNYLALIRLYSSKNEAEKALQITKKLEVEIPNSEWAQISLFKYYIDSNEGQKAVSSMNIVLASSKIDSKIKQRILNEFLIFADKNPQFAPDLEKAISYFDKDPSIDIAKEIGKYYHKEKQWIKAIKYYEQALKNKSGEDIETNLLLFQTYVETKKFDVLEKKALVMIEAFPTQPQFYYFSGLANNQMKQFKKAKEILETGMDYVVGDVLLEINFNMQLGEAYNGLRDFKKKELYFSKANQLLKK